MEACFFRAAITGKHLHKLREAANGIAILLRVIGLGRVLKLCGGGRDDGERGPGCARGRAGVRVVGADRPRDGYTRLIRPVHRLRFRCGGLRARVRPHRLRDRRRIGVDTVRDVGAGGQGQRKPNTERDFHAALAQPPVFLAEFTAKNMFVSFAARQVSSTLTTNL